MLICQPPIYDMDVYTDCCYPTAHDFREDFTETDGKHGVHHLGCRGPFTKIHSDTGLTVGDLYDMTKELQEEHRYCPSARELQLFYEDGTADVEVVFEGTVPLQADDPIIAELGERRLKMELETTQRMERQTQIHLYMTAKASGMTSCEPLVWTETDMRYSCR